METNHLAFDNEELFHLALKAMESGQTEQAIRHLKQLIENEPEHGRAHYLLGALHAEIGMYPRAIEEMQRAVALEPNLPTAHFQLGLLYATSGQGPEAEQAWAALDTLGDRDPLFLFKRGLLHLIRDEFEACRNDLQAGMQLNQVNPALNNDMARILEIISNLPDDTAGGAPATETADAQTQTAQSGGHHVLLNAYQSNDYDKDTEH